MFKTSKHKRFLLLSEYECYSKGNNYLLFNKKFNENQNYDFYFKYKLQDKNKKYYKNIFLKFFAFIPIIIISISLISVIQDNMNNDNLYYKYYTPIPANISRSATIYQNEITEGFIQFNDHNYTKSIEIFENILEKEEKNIMSVNFYLALSYQENRKFRKAIKQYEIIINDNNNIFIEEAKWNMSLCYLKLNEKMKLKEELKNIINDNSFYSRQALALYNKVK